jgi:hypothetical protein
MRKTRYSHGVGLVSCYMEALTLPHLKVHLILDYSIHLLKSLNFLAIMIRIGLEIWMIERVLLDLYSTWVIQHSRGLLRSNR